jgi:hypothetical protein
VTAPGQDAEIPPDETDHCECYKEHNDGKCACDCGCNCVVIARIYTGFDSKKNPIAGSDDPEPPLLYVDNSIRRKIRPVLTGFLGCIKPRETAEPTPLAEQRLPTETTPQLAPEATPKPKPKPKTRGLAEPTAAPTGGAEPSLIIKPPGS